MAAYYLKGVAPPQVQLTAIFSGCLPFVGIVVVGMALMYIFPGIATWLPSTSTTMSSPARCRT
jgi:TRAP-type mannitol/chloroaromatic compound transport system permease large subunit